MLTLQIPKSFRFVLNSLFSLAHLAINANLSGVVSVEPETLLGAASDFSLKLYINQPLIITLLLGLTIPPFTMPS